MKRTNSSQNEIPDWKRWLPGALAILVVTFLSYAPAFRAEYIWDDDVLLTNNPLITEPGGLARTWFSTQFGDFVPFTLTSFWIEFRLWGSNAAGYHAVNVLLHVLSSILFWRILLRLRVPGAFVAAFLFAVHPVNVESVAWIAQRKNTLSLFFFALSLWSYLRSESSAPSNQDTGTQRLVFYWSALGAFLLSLLSKPAGITLPVVLMGIVWWTRGQMNREDIRRIAPFFILAAASSVMALWIQDRQVAHGIENPRDLGERIAGMGWAAWFYAAKAIWPVHLSFIYPRWELNSRAMMTWLPALALMAGFGALWVFRRNAGGKSLLMGLGYYVVTLLPVLGFFHIFFFRYSLVADHYQYFSLIGLLAVVVGIVWRYLSTGGYFIAVPAIAWCVVATTEQCRMYQNSETLWTATLVRNPTAWIAHANLGYARLKDNQHDKAIAHFEAALKINPNASEVESNWGLSLLQLNQPGAEEHFLKALRIKSDNASAHHNYGDLLYERGEFQRAIDHYREALKPQGSAVGQDFSFHNNFGLCLAQLGQIDEAVTHYEEAIRLKPDSSATWNNLAVARISQGQLEKAVDCFKTSLQYTNVADIHNNLGNVLTDLGKTEQALGEYYTALRMDPGLAPADFGVATALKQQGKIADSITYWREGLRLQPDNAEAINQLGWILATTPSDTARNGAEAVRMAEQICASSGFKTAAFISTLAAAYAEAGRFSDAVRAQQQAITVAQSNNQTNSLTQFRAQLESFQHQRPWRESH